MLEQLKNLAMQKLQEKMSANSLNEQATNEAANEGAGALLESLKGGDISQITALLSGNSEGASGIMQNLQGKIGDILQSKGMGQEEAQGEASNVAGNLVNSLKEKFESTSEEDKDFDLGQIGSLLGGNAGDILNKAKNIFG